MRVEKVDFNNRKRGFDVFVESRALWFPYAKLELEPTRQDPLVEAYVDEEIGQEGFSYRLESGAEGTVHVEQVLEYNKDPSFLNDELLYRLTLEAQQRIDSSGLSRREIVRRMGSSASQLYRLLDQTNYRKSIDQMLKLLHVLDCDVEVMVRERSA